MKIENLDRYDNDIFTRPFWVGNMMYHEPIIFFNDEKGVISKGKLLFKPEDIVSIRSSSLEVEYENGKDYFLENGRICIPACSRIPIMNREELFSEKTLFPSRDRKHFYEYLGGKILPKQVAVTYRHHDAWQGPIIKERSDLLPRVTAMLAKGEDVKITFVGDSITANGDTSGSEGIKPFMPKYPDMIEERLRTICTGKITMQNFAIGGTMSRDFFQNETVANNTILSKPDLLVIAYGMNDGGGLGVQPTDFKNMIRRIAKYVCEKNPNCEVIAVSTIIPNTDACWESGNTVACYQEHYEASLLPLEQKGFAVAPMTSVYRYLELKKGFYSLTGNGINHPNDFVVRAYAQTLLTMLGF